jgi:hypothetical protein
VFGRAKGVGKLGSVVLVGVHCLPFCVERSTGGAKWRCKPKHSMTTRAVR